MNHIIIPRPSHYDVLGVGPRSSPAEIEQAFARRISLFTPSAFGSVAQVGIAYQTLRDPVKREQYDRSIGIEPRPRKGLPSLSPGQMMFIAAQHRDPRIRRADPAASVPPPDQSPAAQTPSEIAQDAPPQPMRVTADADLLFREILARRSEPPGSHDEPKDGAFEWKRTGMAVGGVIAAVALIGAWAGWQASNDVEAQSLQAAVNVALPPATARAAGIEPSILAVNEDVAPVAPAPRRYATARTRKRAPDPLAPVSEAPTAGDAPVPAESSAAPAGDQSPAVNRMPLPNHLVARTIEKIGYACGDVASSTAVDGASGVYRVTCTSGHSYQATPVRGRYRFRRII